MNKLGKHTAPRVNKEYTDETTLYALERPVKANVEAVAHEVHLDDFGIDKVPVDPRVDEGDCSKSSPRTDTSNEGAYAEGTLGATSPWFITLFTTHK